MALLLDFDGTLVDIAPQPDAIELAPDLGEILTALADRLDGRVAIVSGRSIADLDRHLGPQPIAMAGSHGGEFRDAGSGKVASLADPFPEAARREVENLAKSLGGLLCEFKPCSAALHYRDAPERENEVLAGATRTANSHGLALKRGKMVAELAMPGSDKGSAVTHLMGLARFTGSQPIFIGDDVTDEDAFAAVRDLGGAGVLVGTERQTGAQWRLQDVAAVHRWLQELL